MSATKTASILMLTPLFVAGLMTSQSMSETVSTCDKLANHPSDPLKVTPGIHQEDVDTAAAKLACAKALDTDPGNGRFLYQLGRSYFYEGNYETGPAIIRQSAETGYPQGQFVYGLILAGGYTGDVDFCDVGRWWLKAANQDHFWAQVYFIDNAVDGSFDGCDLAYAQADIIGFAQAIEKNAEDPRFPDPRRPENADRIQALLETERE